MPTPKRINHITSLNNTYQNCAAIGAIGTCGQILCCHKFLDRPIYEDVSLTEEEKQNLALGLCGLPKCCALWNKKQKTPPLKKGPEPTPTNVSKEKVRKKRVRRIVG